MFHSFLRFITNRLLLLSSYGIRIFEKKFISKYGDVPLVTQPIFIIGAPRTGSTILYQSLTNLYDLLYIDNLVCRFYRNFFFGFWLSNKIYGARPHNNFKAAHGSTEGWHSPSECGQFWYRWLPRDHHFIDHDEITSQMVREVRREITAVINYFNKPIVFKNLNAGQRMRLLTQCFPKAKFIFITRDPVYTAQSILKAKRTLGLADNEFWSIMPANAQELQGLNAYEQIAKQVYYLEKQIVTDSGLVSEGCFFSTHYDDLSLQYIDELSQRFGFLRRTKYCLPSIDVTESISLENNEFQLLKSEVESLEWGFMRKIKLFRSKSISSEENL